MTNIDLHKYEIRINDVLYVCKGKRKKIVDHFVIYLLFLDKFIYITHYGKFPSIMTCSKFNT